MPESTAAAAPNAAREWTAEFKAPSISLPQGGGAIRGIDEKFAANQVTGAGHLTVPIPTSAGRSGFGPQLGLSYDSSGGNGPFGFGWSPSLPSITRRTDKGLPRYADHDESDIFVLSGSEDLVPVLVCDEDGRWIDEPIPPRDSYSIKSFRPRTEGLFARIERWTRCDDGTTHWRSISKDNVETIYGIDADSRIADPRDPTHVFAWLICRSFDDKGNAIVYDYVAENGDGVDLALPSEQHRERSANRYIRRIRYGNRVPLLVDPTTPGARRPHVEPLDVDAAEWMFSVVFDYAEGHYTEQAPDDDGRIFARASYDGQHAWAARRDPFSSFRSTFEVRTHRLCRHVLMFHHLPDELGEENYLVRSTSFAYREKPIGSFLEQVTQSGHTRPDDGRYLTRSLPRLDLSYTPSPLEDPDFDSFTVQDVDEESLANLPTGIDGSDYRFLDLDGVGISGVLTEQDQAWFYKPNLGAGRFGATEVVRERPALATLNDASHRLMDLAGDGNLDLVDLSSSSPGFYERNIDGGWSGFRAFHSLPVLNWSDPNLRLVDVTGDGLADVLITEDDAFTWHPSLSNDGFGPAVRVRIPLDEEESGPRAIFADGTQSIYLADMTGDGLSDVVRIRNGEISYWPNLGYGRFGAKITMNHSPWFDTIDLFDHGRIRLADTDGSGTSDILYLGRNRVEVFLNEAGNGWSHARRIESFPAADNLASVDAMDFLGRGTTCLVWSSPLPGDQGRQLRYLDLMCGRKPHLLERVVNHAGAETRIEYASSTEFYLADRAAGRPWITRLPFPVHVVKRIETYDEVSRNRFVSRYTFHHGFYDGLEREFRGFGRVDQLDTEDIASLTAPGVFPTGDNIDPASSVPPVLTKTWIHTGVFLASGRISHHLAHEYFGDGVRLDDTILPHGLTPFEAREACRALKGSTLRQETYALDGTAKARIPFTVAENNFTVRVLQPLATNRYAVFFTHPRETISFHYERDPDDPRVGHTVTLAVDDYGNVLTSASIGYARRAPAIEEQSQVLATLVDNRYTNAIVERDAYRAPMPAQASTYELTAPELRGSQPLGFDDVERLAASAHEIPFDAKPIEGRIEKRLIERQRSLYRKNDLGELLPLGRVESMALPGESFKLALTSGLLDVFRAKSSPSEMRSILGGAEYRDLDGDGPFWVPSGQVFFSPDPRDPAGTELEFAKKHFFLPHLFRDPFGNTSVVAYDRYNLSLVYTRDAVGNETASEPDYRVLLPRQVTDPNGNRAQARFDALGMLTGTALMGKAIGPVEGDSFDHFVADLTPSQLTEFFAVDDPRSLATRYLGAATTRTLYDFRTVPICAASIARETHVSDLAPGSPTKVQVRFGYSDGFGREAQRKVPAEPGPLDPDDRASPFTNPRWIGSGSKIYNNKGKPVREYEPFFSPTPHFGIERWGVSNILFYDPVQRVVATLHPNHTYEKAVFDPWKQITFDVNDTATFDPSTDSDVGEYFRRLPESDYLPTWYQQRIGGAEGPHERRAAIKASKDAGTPTAAHVDTLGRTVLSIADNGDGHYFRTRTVLDVEGNQLAVIDPLDRVAVRYDYDMLKTPLHQASMEAGERWMLNDAGGNPVRAWNSRGFAFRTEYDHLRRPTKSFVEGGGLPHEVLFEHTIYGEGAETGLTQAQRKRANVRGKAFRHFDGAGVVVTDLNDFKGNPLHASRRFTREYKQALDWSQPQTFEARTFSSATRYDALNRATAVTAPDDSIYRPTFNDANLLEAVDVDLRGGTRNGQPVFTPFITHINYDAKGQRTMCRYANGVQTTYEYDPETFRLMHLRTTRLVVETGRSARIFEHPTTLQDLRYTYDPIGNIARIGDDALKTVFHANQKIEPACEYSYDATYRLIEATGREHIGQAAFDFSPVHDDDRDYPFAGAERLNDLEALQRYVESYAYDSAGNVLAMLHRAVHRNWTRAYAYRELSLLAPTRHSNRLSETAFETRPDAPVERYRYDAHGNMTQMPHLPSMEWNYKDQLSATSPQVVNEGRKERETTYYVYDASGQRARKVTERECGKRSSERFYVGGFEVFREFSGEDVAMERETLHVMDDTRRIALVETKTIADGDAIDTPAPEQRYQLANHQGSASVEVDDAGGLITYEEYSPYGNTTYQAGFSAADVRRKRYRYTAKERDRENSFTYHGARYYAPWLGRWTSCDPSGMADGPNLYQYARANPTNRVDRNGRQSDDDLHGIGTSHHTPEQAAAARAASAATPPAPSSPPPPSPTDDPLKNAGHSSVPGPGSDAALPSSQPAKLGSDVQMQNVGPNQNAFVPRAIRPFVTLEATGSALIQSPTDPSQGWTGQLGAGLQARFTLTPNVELGAGGTYGRVFTLNGQSLQGPSAVGTAYGSVHFSEAQPANADTANTRGAGFFGQLGGAFGAGPNGQTGLYGSATGAYSWSWPGNSVFQGVDLNAGVAGAGYSQLNGVNVGNVVSPFAGANLSLPGHVNFEVYGSLPVATGGNLSDPTATATPYSFRLGAGLGVQVPLGDYAVAAEVGVVGEFSNVRVPNQPDAPFSNFSPWLNIGIGAVGRRTTFGDTGAFPSRF